MILIPRFTFSIGSQSSQWCRSFVWLASLHLGCCDDFLDQTFLSHAHASIISVFHSNAETFSEVTFHLQVESFILKFLDQFVNAFSFGAAILASSACETISTHRVDGTSICQRDILGILVSMALCADEDTRFLVQTLICRVIVPPSSIRPCHTCSRSLLGHT